MIWCIFRPFSSVALDFSIFPPKDLQKTVGPPFYELVYRQIPLASGVKRKYNICQIGCNHSGCQVQRFSQMGGFRINPD
jgi:hypothetical protein